MGWAPHNRACTWCGACGKWAYPSRKEARQSARARRGEAGLRAYRCPELDAYWHIGHIPQAAFEGRKTAREVYGQ